MTQDEIRRNEYFDWAREDKERAILTAIETLEKNGYATRLKNKQNGHLQITSKHGVVFNYYPTTGTVAGYDWDSARGTDDLLQLLEEG